MTRRHTRRFALLTLLGLLFAQFALAAYACQWAGPAGHGDGLQVEMTVVCDRMDPTAAAAMGLLCAQHCKAESGTFDTGTVSAQGAVAMIVLPFIFRIQLAHLEQVPPDPDVAAAGRPPLLALHARLRI